MTRKDCKIIAEAIKESQIDNGSKANIVAHLCRHLSVDNSRFDQDKFVEAIGVNI